MRRLTLAGRLILIISAAIVPLALVAAFALMALLKGQEEQTSASTASVARALAAAVDGEMRLIVSALHALSLTEAMGATNSQGAIQEQGQGLIKALRASHSDWRAVLLVAPSGAIVFSTEGIKSPAATEVVERKSLEQAVRTQEPAIGPMLRGPSGEFAFAVRVPVIRDGQVLHVLTAVVRPEQVAAVLARQRVPEGWSASVFDENNARVARTTADDRLRGTLPSESLQRLIRQMNGRSEAVGPTTTVEGQQVQTAVARLASAPWTVALGASVSAAERIRDRTLLAYGGGLVLSVVLGALAAWWLSRAITSSVSRLGQNTIDLERRMTVPAKRSGIIEIDLVADALAAASTDRTRMEADRNSLLVSEKVARTRAEDAGQRLARLVDASAVLSASLEESSTLAAIAEVVVPGVADLCRIDLLDDEGKLHRKLTHHSDPERRRAIASMVASRDAGADVPGSFPWAIATGKTYLHNIDDPDRPAVDDPDMRDFVATLGITAACVVPLIARGRTIGAMAVIQAESRRRFTQQDGVLIGELAQRAALALDNVKLLADARDAQAHAEAANLAKDEFLAMLGHELRNPLAPISLALQLIARKDDRAFPRERQIIERQVKHLSRMVDDLLDVSRIVAGKIAINLENVDLREVVKRALELTLPVLQTRAAMPELTLPPSAVIVRGDAVRLAQIVANLLNNAAKFTAPSERISVLLTTNQEEAQLAVIDCGVGIAPELQPRVFERFVQGEQALQRASGGLGLGLAIAQSLARLHHGDLHLFSAGLGHGSTFTLSLPIMSHEHIDGESEAPLPKSKLTLRLLLVDDNLDGLAALRDWFVLEGHEVFTASSAEDALVMLETTSVEAGVFDIGLPGMSGYELARCIRSDPRIQSMVLIALTGYGRESDRTRAIQDGFDDHVAKPPQVERLLERLRALVIERDAARKESVS